MSDRELQDWMALDQEEVDNMDEDIWEHYKNRGCLCHAYEPNECVCGAWDDVYDCEYAIEKIREIGGDGMVELYQYWLDDGFLETKALNDDWKDADFDTTLNDRPFEQFKELWDYWEGRVRKKKHRIKQVLWVWFDCHHNKTGHVWLEDGKDAPQREDCYQLHKVPTCIREGVTYE